MLALDDLMFEPDDRGWRAEAACAGSDLDLFFPPEDDFDKIAEAKDVCATCPVVDDCLQFALSTNQTDGVWGGMDANERRRLRRRLRDQARRRLAS